MNDQLSISEDGRALTKLSEGLALVSYQDPGGVWTIGYGHTKTAKRGMRITIEQANTLLHEDMRFAEEAVRSKVKVPLSQGQYDALVDFVFNVGAGAFDRSTLLRLLNQGLYLKAANEFRRWIYQGKVQLPGLVKRRAAETILFLREA